MPVDLRAIAGLSPARAEAGWPASGTVRLFRDVPADGQRPDAAVMATGHSGFGLGATPNAVATMKSVVERFGAAPRAFLVVPMVGAFFIDFTNR